MRGGYGSKVSEVAYTTLRHDVVRVALAESSTLQEVHNVGFAGTLLVQAVFVLLEADGSTKDNLVSTSREPIIAIVEYDFN